VITLLNPTRGDKKVLFIDIGSGEGHVIEYFARHLNCQCLGIESDPICMKKAYQKIQESHLTDQVTFVEEDAEKFPYQSYCVCYDEVIVYMFLSSFGYSIMGRKLLEELPIGSRIVTAVNPIGNYWKPLCAWIGSDQDLTLYLSIVTKELKESFVQSSPPLSLQETRWRHPPPGSYFPQPLPDSLHVIPHETSHTEASRLCQEYFRLAQAASVSQTSTPGHSASSSSSSNLDSFLPSSTTFSSTKTHQTTIRLPPPPPPLPPPLPGMMKRSK
jgi:hypothetical protein